MDTRFYQSPGLDLERIARNLEGYYLLTRLSGTAFWE